MGGIEVEVGGANLNREKSLHAVAFGESVEGTTFISWFTNGLDGRCM